MFYQPPVSALFRRLGTHMNETTATPDSRLKETRRGLLAGGTAIMLLCQLFYGALQFSALERLSRERLAAS